MQMLRLLRLAQQAETLRWRRIGRRGAIQAGLAGAAAIFALLGLGLLHGAAFIWLARAHDPALVALGLGGLDALVVALLAWLALRSKPDPVALQAQQVRDDALRKFSQDAGQAALLMPLMGKVSAKQGLIGGGLLAAGLGLLRWRQEATRTARRKTGDRHERPRGHDI
jgi:hypothetical protein